MRERSHTNSGIIAQTRRESERQVSVRQHTATLRRPAQLHSNSGTPSRFRVRERSVASETRRTERERPHGADGGGERGPLGVRAHPGPGRRRRQHILARVQRDGAHACRVQGPRANVRVLARERRQLRAQDRRDAHGAHGGLHGRTRRGGPIAHRTRRQRQHASGRVRIAAHSGRVWRTRRTSQLVIRYKYLYFK
jgi:hypothetical protein